MALSAASLKRALKTRLGPFVAERRPSRVDLPPGRWELTVGTDGRLRLGSVELVELAREHGTPVHVCNAGALDRRADAALGSGADIFFSYKTNPVPGVLRRLHDAGIGAEVISHYELWLALRLGVDPARIIYNGPAKSVESLRLAVREGLLLVNVNSRSELERLGAVASEEGRTVDVGVRMAVAGGWGGQFGMAAGSDALAEAVDVARSHPRLRLRGLHVHRGLVMREPETFVRYAESVLQGVEDLWRRSGWAPELLDLGGSLACATTGPITTVQHRLNRALGTDLLPPDPDACLDLADAGRLAVALVEEQARRGGWPVPRVILEPGRALTGDTQFLLTSVVDVKDDTGLVHAVLDAGINVAEPVPNEYHQLLSASAAGTPATTPYRLVGPICTPADVLYFNWRLPPLQPGHVLAIMDSGAYFVPFSTSFSFPRPPVVLVADGRVTTLRRREQFTDLVGLDDAGDLNGRNDRNDVNGLNDLNGLNGQGEPAT